MNHKFVHLRVHTVYSLSESTLRISKLSELAKNDRQPAMAITDSQNIFGGYEFSKAMEDELDKILESKNPEEAKVKFLEDSYTKIKKHIEGYENA